MHNTTITHDRRNYAKYYWRDFYEDRPVYGEQMFRCRDRMKHNHQFFKFQVLMKEASLRNRAIDELNKETHERT